LESLGVNLGNRKRKRKARLALEGEPGLEEEKRGNRKPDGRVDHDKTYKHGGSRIKGGSRKTFLRGSKQGSGGGRKKARKGSSGQEKGKVGKWLPISTKEEMRNVSRESSLTFIIPRPSKEKGGGKCNTIGGNGKKGDRQKKARGGGQEDSTIKELTHSGTTWKIEERK